jgi:carboxylesterase type B
MVGHNADEGLFFTSPGNADETEFEQNIRLTIPTVSNATLEYITSVLYPQVYDGSYGYTDPYARAATAAADLGIVCNTYYLDTGFKNQTYSYFFSIFPALHGDDVPYTFYDDEGIIPGEIDSISAALTLQDWIVTFAATGVPTAPDVPSTPSWPIYGPNAQRANIGATSITIQTDDAANLRCDWWQKALYV